MTVDTDRMRQAAKQSFVLATDIADYLVKKGVPFREAHIAVGELTRQCMANGKSLLDLSLDDYRAASPLFDEGVLGVTLESSVAARDVAGGTAPGWSRGGRWSTTRSSHRGCSTT